MRAGTKKKMVGGIIEAHVLQSHSSYIEFLRGDLGSGGAHT